MKQLNKMASVLGAAVFGLLALTNCEGGELYNLDAPDWISEKVDSINNAKPSTEDAVIEGLEEDVYTVGNTDYSTGWWASFSKYYVIPEGEKWITQFNLGINPAATNTYKNFALILCSDADRGGAGYIEYGAIRFDNQPSGNSEWGDHIDRSCVESTLTFATDTDAGVEKLGGKVTLTIDRTDPSAFTVTMTNGTVTKTYKPKSPLPNLNADASNTNIRAFLVPEGSYISFLGSTIEPIGGYTSAEDKLPVSMDLLNVPDEVPVGTTLEEAVAGITANVYFESVPTPKTVTAEELTFQAIPDMENPGEKTLVAIYNKTFKGENADTPVMAFANFRLVLEITAIEVLTPPAHMAYYYYNDPVIAAGVERTLAFDPTGMEVQATYSDGTTAIMDNSKLLVDGLPTIAGTYDVTISTSNSQTAVVEGITVVESEVTLVHPTPTILGNEDNTSGWWSAHSDNILVPAGATYQVNFTNYSSGGGNWNNYVIVLRAAAGTPEYAVVRADNYGWGGGYEGNTNLINSGGQADWATWLAAMNGAKCTAYITNVGNGTADIQVLMNGTDGNAYIQYYMGINTVNVDDLNFAFTVDSSHYEFE